MALPTSDLPGHKQLHDRVVAALERCQESQDIDFKESATWGTLKWKIIATALGMGNLRDGGIIVIGVSERDMTWDLSGIDVNHLRTYDADNIQEQTNKYVSPHVDIDVVLVDHKAKWFVAIHVREFQDTPLVCKKDGHEGKGIAKGSVYVRPPGKAQTTRIQDANQLHQLLELAAEKRARRILEVSRRIGMVEPAAEEDHKASEGQYDKELGGL